MERNKMEEEFKNKLNEREIAPTPHGWDRLEAMLNTPEEKKVPVRRLNWLYIAAGFIGIIFIGTMFFNNGPITNDGKVAVEETKINTVDQNPATAPGDSTANVNDAVANNQEINNSPVNDKTKMAGPNGAVQQKQPLKLSLPMRVDRQMQMAHVENQTPSVIEPQSHNELLTENSANVQSEQLAVVESGMKNPKTIKVDPNSLLSQVDGELELSFREKVIKIASKKYQNVKVALENRNLGGN